MANQRRFLWEVQLSQGHWASIPAELATWYRYNYEQESRLRRQQIIAEATQVIGRIIDEELTDRQRQVVSLYFMGGNTQVQVGQELGIAQPTVSQHLTGKRRNGKKVGGALKRIRRTIRRAADREGRQADGMNVLLILDALLADGITRRAATTLLGREP